MRAHFQAYGSILSSEVLLDSRILTEVIGANKTYQCLVRCLNLTEDRESTFDELNITIENRHGHLVIPRTSGRRAIKWICEIKNASRLVRLTVTSEHTCRKRTEFAYNAFGSFFQQNYFSSRFIKRLASVHLKREKSCQLGLQGCCRSGRLLIQPG